MLGGSPKVGALLEAVGEMADGEKGIIFSQFTSFLDKIGRSFRMHGHAFTRIDGSMSSLKRIEAMRDFSADGGPRLILCSLMACGTGINLTRAKHVFMLETWWNKSAEDQANDRCHRMGQTRPVRVIRFVMAGSFEERMINLQETKAALGKGAMAKLTAREARQLRMGHVRSLFDLPLPSDENEEFPDDD